MNTEYSTGTVFRFDSYGIRFNAVCVDIQNGQVQCFRVCTNEESSKTIGMHMSDGRSAGPNYRIAYRCKFKIHMSQVKTPLFNCSTEDVSWANKLHSCLMPVKNLRVQLEDTKRALSLLTDEARTQALKKIEAMSEEVYERECIFLREHLYYKKASYYESFRVVPNLHGITQIYGLYQEWHVRKTYR